MAYTIERIDVWSGAIKDRPGGLAGALAPLTKAGANLDFAFARQDKRGKGLVFLAPIKGAKATKAAKTAGLSKSGKLVYLRVTGPDKAGLGAKITSAMGDAKINMIGLSATAIGRKSVCYVELKKKDAAKARAALKKTL